MVLNNNNMHIAYAELPITKKRIKLSLVYSIEKWNEIKRIYWRLFSKLILVEYDNNRDFGKKAKEISILSNKNIKQKVVIPRIKKEKKLPIKGNLLVKVEGDTTYILANCFKKRKILKIDSEDFEKINTRTKSSFYLIARRFSGGEINFILSKHKRRQSSIYSMIFERTIKTKVIHIDGDYFNFKKSNLKILDSDGYKIKRISHENIFNPTKLTGFSKESRGIGYEIRIYYKGKRIKIGYAKTPEDAAKLYDIANLYYNGKTINYPADYYFNFEQDLVSKWNDNLSRRKIQPEK